MYGCSLLLASPLIATKRIKFKEEKKNIKLIVQQNFLLCFVNLLNKSH